MYTKPTLTLEELEVEDVITTSTAPVDQQTDPYELEHQSLGDLMSGTI